MIISAVILLSILFLVAASIEDLKTGEIPEKISFGLGGLILIIAASKSILEYDVNYLIQSLFLGIIYFAVGYVLYYLGQWGGGDVKVTASLGCALGFLSANGFSWPSSTWVPFQANFFINVAVLSTPYVLIYTIIIGLSKPDLFRKFFNSFRQEKLMTLVFISSFAPLLLAAYTKNLLLVEVYALIPLLVLSTIYLKIVESEAMRKTISVNDIKEWDIVAEDVKSEGKTIAWKRDIEGVSKKQIEEIQKLAEIGMIPKDITIKWGVKFAPTLLLAFIFTVWKGNLVELIIIYLIS
ncbi:MAG: A24 family peptidase [Candidatus Altiarchaeota archaeon]